MDYKYIVKSFKQRERAGREKNQTKKQLSELSKSQKLENIPVGLPTV